MKWISVLKEGKPKKDCMTYVTNAKNNSGAFVCLYTKEKDCFVMYDPTTYDHPALEVTHYVILPYVSGGYELD